MSTGDGSDDEELFAAPGPSPAVAPAIGIAVHPCILNVEEVLQREGATGGGADTMSPPPLVVNPAAV